MSLKEVQHCSCLCMRQRVRCGSACAHAQLSPSCLPSVAHENLPRPSCPLFYMKEMSEAADPEGHSPVVKTTQITALG